MKDEYIHQQDAIDDLHTQLMYRMGSDDMKRRLDDWVTTLPSADVVPVVMCKDCRKRRKDGYCTKFIQNINGIASVWYMPQDDDFCSYGERREG